MEFTPENAPLVVLSFLGTGFLLGVAGLVFVHALAKGKHTRARIVLAAGFAAGAGYLGLLLGFSFFSSEKVLAVGELKYFCEVDCHVAYSVVDLRTAKTLGAGANQATAAGTYYVVTIKTWFDERTISRRRARDMPLWPSARIVRVVDDQGRRYDTSLAGQKALEVAGSVPLTQPLRPGESYTTTLVFDLPAGAQSLRLLISALDPITALLIGHENSFFHKKIFFRLEPNSIAKQSKAPKPTPSLVVAPPSSRRQPDA